MREYRIISPQEIMENPEELRQNLFELIGKQWYLFTAGGIDSYNTMTASWGTAGILWGKPVVNSFIRPVRHTYDFIEKGDIFTLSFFLDEKQRSVSRRTLAYCGKYSGRDVDKAAECSLTPVELDGGVGFTEADLIIVCRKLYFYDIAASQMVDKTLDSHYPNRDYHRGYFGEIVNIYER